MGGNTNGYGGRTVLTSRGARDEKAQCLEMLQQLKTLAWDEIMGKSNSYFYWSHSGYICVALRVSAL